MDIKTKKIIYNVDLVEKLRKILFFQIVAPLSLSVLWFFIQIAIVNVIRNEILAALVIYFSLLAIIGAVLLFIPYLFYVLIKEKRYGWIAIFFFMIVLPYIVILLIFHGFVLLSAWLLVPVIPFFLYCFLLKYSVAEWLNDYYTHKDYEEEKIESAKRKQDEMRWAP